MQSNLHSVPEQPAEPAGDDAAKQEAHAALELHLDTMLDRLQTEVKQPESETRRDTIENVTGEYTLGLLEGMIADDGQFEAQLIQKGARDANENWDLLSPLFTFLNEQMAGSIPTRLTALENGQYRDTTGQHTDKQMLNDGVRKQLRNLVKSFIPRRDVFEGQKAA
ncbi:MAG: hypothetical protein Q7S02_02280 [bacterium]|nr:hypothetical protein [bacterium]